MDFVFQCLLCHGSWAVLARPLLPKALPRPLGITFQAGAHSPALSGKLPFRFFWLIPPPQAQSGWRSAHSRPRAPILLQNDHQVALPLADGRCRADPQTHLVLTPGQSSPGRGGAGWGAYKSKKKTLITALHPHKWEGDSSLTSGFSPLSLFHCCSRLPWMASFPICLRERHQGTGCRERLSPQVCLTAPPPSPPVRGNTSRSKPET